MAGLLDLLPLLGGLCCVALALGLSVGAPPATPLFLLVAAQQLLWIALLEHAVGVAKRVLAGSRLAMAALALATVRQRWMSQPP